MNNSFQFVEKVIFDKLGDCREICRMTFLNPEDVQRYLERVEKWQIYAKKWMIFDVSSTFVFVVLLYFSLF